MKITFTEEIEARRAWLGNMYCPKCVCGKYNIHHQLEPVITECWWIECPECGHESLHVPTREIAIMEWQGENEADYKL